MEVVTEAWRDAESGSDAPGLNTQESASRVSVSSPNVTAERSARSGMSDGDVSPQAPMSPEKVVARVNRLRESLHLCQSKEDAVTLVKELVGIVSTTFPCVLAPDSVVRIRKVLNALDFLDKQVAQGLNILEQRCRSRVAQVQEELDRILVQQEFQNKSAAQLAQDIQAAEDGVQKADKAVQMAQEGVEKAQQQLNAAILAKEKAKSLVEEISQRVPNMEQVGSKLVAEAAVLSKNLANIIGDNDAVRRQSTTMHENEPEKTSEGGPSAQTEVTQQSNQERGGKRKRDAGEEVRGSSRGGASRQISLPDSAVAVSSPAKRQRPENQGRWMYEEGMAYYFGNHFKTVDKLRGKLMVEGAAKAGFRCAVAECYYHGWGGVEEDEEKAFEIWKDIADKSQYPPAQHSVGVCYEHGEGVERDISQALTYYHVAASLGQSEAQNNIANCLKMGRGVGKDEDAAATWYKKAAEQGNMRAHFNLGVMFHEGKAATLLAATEDPQKDAVACFRHAASRGHAGAHYWLGLCYERGSGVSPDPKSALVWFTGAAKSDHGAAMFKCGNCFEHGEGTNIDIRQAVHWYRKAAKRGHKEAAKRLAHAFLHGQGVEADQAEAMKWFAVSDGSQTLA